MLRPNGHIVILTPTGSGGIQAKLIKQIGLSVNNWTFFMWRALTASNGQAWAAGNKLATFATENQLTYHKQSVFQDLAVIEVLYSRTVLKGGGSNNTGEGQVKGKVVITVEHNNET